MIKDFAPAAGNVVKRVFGQDLSIAESSDDASDSSNDSDNNDTSYDEDDDGDRSDGEALCTLNPV